MIRFGHPHRALSGGCMCFAEVCPTTIECNQIRAEVTNLPGWTTFPSHIQNHPMVEEHQRSNILTRRTHHPSSWKMYMQVSNYTENVYCPSLCLSGLTVWPCRPQSETNFGQSVSRTWSRSASTRYLHRSPCGDPSPSSQDHPLLV